MLWAFQLKNILDLSFCDISIMVLIDLINRGHDLIEHDSWLLLDDVEELFIGDRRLLFDGPVVLGLADITTHILRLIDALKSCNVYFLIHFGKHDVIFLVVDPSDVDHCVIALLRLTAWERGLHLLLLLLR